MANSDPDQLAALHEVRSLLLKIVEALVDDVNSIDLSTEELSDATCFHIRVQPSDVGKLIGKQGRMACSIRTVLNAASRRVGHRYMLDICG